LVANTSIDISGVTTAPTTSDEVEWQIFKFWKKKELYKMTVID
jgi:hypothetical protein